MNELSYTLKQDERGTRLIKRETSTKGNTLDGARGNVEVRWLIKNKVSVQ